MKFPFPPLSNLCLTFTGCALAVMMAACVDEIEGEGFSATNGSSASGSTTSRPKLNKHDVALRFLTAYIRLDKNMALQFASPEAVEKLDWTRRHSGNIPYYDDKMILYFSGGWARVYFQEINGSYIVSDLDVHRKR